MDAEMINELILFGIVLLQILTVVCMILLAGRMPGDYGKGSAGSVIKALIAVAGSALITAGCIVFIIIALHTGSAPREEYMRRRSAEAEAEQAANNISEDEDWEEAVISYDQVPEEYTAEIPEEQPEGLPETAMENTNVDDVTTDGMVAVYTRYFAGQEGSKYETDWDAKGVPGAVLYEDDEVIRYLRYDRLSKNGKCCLYVYYEDTKDGSADTRILDMYAYDTETGEVIDSGRRAWADVGTPEYREATGE